MFRRGQTLPVPFLALYDATIHIAPFEIHFCLLTFSGTEHRLRTASRLGKACAWTIKCANVNERRLWPAKGTCPANRAGSRRQRICRITERRPLIRARSVVQVHPGPPFKSPVNTWRFSLFPFRGISLKKPICQLFANFPGNHKRLPGRALAGGESFFTSAGIPQVEATGRRASSRTTQVQGAILRVWGTRRPFYGDIGIRCQTHPK